jgi:hypothetical protein
MTRTLIRHAVSFSLALLVTLSTLVGLDTLASAGQGTPAQIAAAPTARA